MATPPVIIFGNPVAQASLVVTPSSGSNPLTLLAHNAFAEAAKAQAAADVAEAEAKAAETLAIQKRAHANALKVIAVSKNALAAQQTTIQPTLRHQTAVVIPPTLNIAPGSRRTHF